MFPIRDHNPSGRVPFITYALIGLNVAIFLLVISTQTTDRAMTYFLYDWGLVPARISTGTGYGQVLTSMFLHGSWMHLLGNMLFLHIFGDNLEDQMGPGRFLLFYLASGVAAALLQYAADPLSNVPMVGASGAIAGVLGGYLLLYPRARVDVVVILFIFIRIIALPAWMMLGFWFVMQLINGLTMTTDMGGVAYWAHMGGFVAGLVLTLPIWVRLGGPGYWARTHGLPQNPQASYRIARTTIPRVRRRR
jgi:membrane associated rhomboid family serine protease